MVMVTLTSGDKLIIYIIKGSKQHIVKLFITKTSMYATNPGDGTESKLFAAEYLQPNTLILALL